MRSIGSLLGNFLRLFQNDPEKTDLFLKELWPQIVGAQLARRTIPLRLRAGVLHIAVPAGPWKRELQPLSESILAEVNRYWGSRLVDSVNFEVQSAPNRARGIHRTFD